MRLLSRRGYFRRAPQPSTAKKPRACVKRLKGGHCEESAVADDEAISVSALDYLASLSMTLNTRSWKDGRQSRKNVTNKCYVKMLIFMWKM
jgi:hypothetical protein